MTRWKNAVEAQDTVGMNHARDKLISHIEKFYEHLSVTRADVEREGLGLRPITAAEKLGKSDRSVLARRYYRLAQWSETLQESFWITVRGIILGRTAVKGVVADGLCRIQTLRCTDTIQ